MLHVFVICAYPFICHEHVVSPQIMKLEEDMYKSQLPTLRKILENYEAAAKLLRQLPGEFNKVSIL